mgnify:CR=1 FL=1
MKTPLQPKQNKRACIDVVQRIIPPRSVVHCFPFFTGEIELELLRGDRFVVGHTHQYVVYEFWRCLMADPLRVSEVIKHFSPLNEVRIFQMLQRKWPEYKDPFVRSGIFFLLNHHSTTGMISSGEFDPRPVAPTALNRIRQFKPTNFHLQFDKESDFIKEAQNITDDSYMIIHGGNYHLDVLQEGVNLGYEETPVSHDGVRELFISKRNPTLLIYNYHPRLLRIYGEHSIQLLNKYGRETTNAAQCKEVVIANF